MQLTLVPKYFPDFSATELEKLTQFSNLLLEWNTKINLISRQDADNFEERHLLHSLAVYKFIQFEADTQVLDLGTGGGLPGLPLAILQPQAHFTLLDSTRKKLGVVEEIIKIMNLTNVSVSWIRAEEHTQKYDFVLGRAVTALHVFYKLANPLIHCECHNKLKNGVLYLKGGEFREELALAKALAKQVIPLNNFFTEAFFETKNLVYLQKCK